MCVFPCVACVQMRMHACATMHLCVCVRIYDGRTQIQIKKIGSQNTKKQSRKISMYEHIITVIWATCVHACLRLCVCVHACAVGGGYVHACACTRDRFLLRWISAAKELQLKHTNQKTTNKWSHLDTYEIQIYTVRLDIRGKKARIQLVCCAAGVRRACVSVCWCMRVCVLVYGCLRCWGEGTVV